MDTTAHLEVAVVETADGLSLVSALTENDEEVRFRVPADALILLGPQPCEMTHTPPFDFAQCEKHDTTFPLGEECKFHNRDPWEVIYDEADAQRRRAVIAERDRDEALDRAERAQRECDVAHIEADRLRKEVDMLYDRLKTEEDPVVLLVDRFTSTCGECGRPADSREKQHLWDDGCGRTFTHIGSRYFITPEFEDRLRAMRPDLTLKKT
ncbi:hypothetical protein [Aeromicrobium sp. 179-A 4D2 NHS]|uniref:hypothetical protein n=1 Tax=Aeromicrobium sp. 179-A 4D2 NHS TaxID=3142375 RepID=UPI00399EFBF5